MRERGCYLGIREKEKRREKHLPLLSSKTTKTILLAVWESRAIGRNAQSRSSEICHICVTSFLYGPKLHCHMTCCPSLKKKIRWTTTTVCWQYFVLMLQMTCSMNKYVNIPNIFCVLNHLNSGCIYMQHFILGNHYKVVWQNS